MEEMQPSRYKASGDKQSAMGGRGTEKNTYRLSSSCQVLSQTLHTWFTHDSPRNHVIYCAPDGETDIQRS